MAEEAQNLIELSTPKLFSCKDMAEAELHSLGPGLVAIYSHKSPTKSTDNEDCAAIIPYDQNSGALVVADGCGGMPMAAKAAEIAVTSLRTTLRHGKKNGDPLRSAILDGIEKANQEVLDLGVGAGTTLVVAEIFDDKMRTYHVGDSQATLIGQKGKMKFQTTAHSPVGYAVAHGLLDEKEALDHEERHVVSNSVGDPNMSIEVGTTVEVAAKDTIVIASDGLYDNLTQNEIIELVRKGQILGSAREIIETCKSRMIEEHKDKPSKPDDLTFILYRRRVSA